MGMICVTVSVLLPIFLIAIYAVINNLSLRASIKTYVPIFKPY